jgi:hypothetical protein
MAVLVGPRQRTHLAALCLALPAVSFIDRHKQLMAVRCTRGRAQIKPLPSAPCIVATGSHLPAPQQGGHR